MYFSLFYYENTDSVRIVRGIHSGSFTSWKSLTFLIIALRIYGFEIIYEGEAW